MSPPASAGAESIPYTPSLPERILAWDPRLWSPTCPHAPDLLNAFPHIGLFSPVEIPARSPLPESRSALRTIANMGGMQRRFVRSVMAVPPNIRGTRSVDAFWFTTLLHLIRRPDLRFVSVWNPSFLELPMDREASSLTGLQSRYRKQNPPSVLQPLRNAMRSYGPGYERSVAGRTATAVPLRADWRFFPTGTASGQRPDRSPRVLFHFPGNRVTPRCLPCDRDSWSSCPSIRMASPTPCARRLAHELDARATLLGNPHHRRRVFTAIALATSWKSSGHEQQCPARAIRRPEPIADWVR